MKQGFGCAKFAYLFVSSIRASFAQFRLRMWENGPEAVQTICELLAFAVALGDSVGFFSNCGTSWSGQFIYTRQVDNMNMFYNI